MKEIRKIERSRKRWRKESEENLRVVGMKDN
jgi:hypothetical protein